MALFNANYVSLLDIEPVYGVPMASLDIEFFDTKIL